MIKSTIESIVKLPLEIPAETGGSRSKKDSEPRSLSKRVEPKEKEQEKDLKESDPTEPTLYSKGYIKYPAYDFF